MTLNLNGSSQVTSDSDLNAKTTTYGITSGKLTSIQDPNGNTTSVSYPTPPGGAVWQVNVTTPANSTSGGPETTQYVSYPQGTRPPAGQPTCGGSPSGELPYGYTIETLPDANWREYCYDTHDRVYETFDEASRQPTLTTYDANDDITQVVGPTNTEFASPTLIEGNSFDACFRPTAETSGSGAGAPSYTQSYQNPAPTTCAASSPNQYLPSTATPPPGSRGQATELKYTYDGSGNIKQINDGLATQNTLSFDYYADGLLKDSYNADGQETTYAYTWGIGSWPGVLASSTVTPPTPMHATSDQYDLAGRTSSVADGNSNTTSFSYYNNDNVHVETYQGGATTTNSYDSDGNLLSAVDTQTGTTSYVYWPDNQLETETDPYAPGQASTTTNYTYNGNSDMASIADAGGTVSYGYDTDDRVNSVTQPGTGTPFTFTYDNDGRLICTSYPNGMVAEQLYDAYNNLTSIQTANGTASCNQASTTGTPAGTVFQDNAYTYAAGSDLAQTQTITSGGTSTAWNYYYDPLNRLIEAAGGSAGTYNYAYDGDGNLISKTTSPTTGAIQTAAYNNDNELCWVLAGSSTNPCGTTPTGAYSASYDNAGNLTSLGSSGGTTSLGYNTREQTNSLNPFGAGAQALSYRGSGQNHPVQIGNTSGGVAPELEENTLGISAQEPSSGSATYYTRAPGGSLLSERTPGGTYYYVQDANNSVVTLTNSTDTVANTYTYDPYGTTTSTTGSAPNIFGYDGGYNAQGGLVLFGTRYYNPATGSWTQPDPDAQSLAQDPTQADAYSFASDDPSNSTDPTGTVDFLNEGGGDLPGEVRQAGIDGDSGTRARCPRDWRFSRDAQSEEVSRGAG